MFPFRPMASMENDDIPTAAGMVYVRVTANGLPTICCGPPLVLSLVGRVLFALTPTPFPFLFPFPPALLVLPVRVREEWRQQ